MLEYRGPDERDWGKDMTKKQCINIYNYFKLYSKKNEIHIGARKHFLLDTIFIITTF